MAILPYRPEMPLDFGQLAWQRAAEEALQRVRRRLGDRVGLLLGDHWVQTADQIVSRNPARPAEIVGYTAKAGGEQVDRAVEAAWAAFDGWQRVPAPSRAACLWKAAAMMRRERLELDAWEVLEAGKSWPEADADVAEAIDFLEYYGRQMIRLGRPVALTPLAGEQDDAFYIPLGVGAVVPPWNFPLAILTGMCSAAIVAGNTVVLKPASPTPIIAAQFVRIMREAGVPAGVLNFVPGDGSEIGDYLVSHPRIRFISFTGSRDVGLRINQLAAQPRPEQRWIKRVIAEMGGKDAIIVDETADLASAVQGIMRSAFGFQGQKCSACSRAIVVEAVYEDVIGRLGEMAKGLRMGPPEDFSVAVGPVITEAAQHRIMQYIAWGKRHARLVAGGRMIDHETGYFIEPTIFGEVAPGSKLEQEEIFGPVLSVIRAGDWDEALAIANDTEYGLTGSVYSQRRDRIDAAREVFQVGNLYINRKSTGAVVGAHPFGGFNMSGTDSKTGSPDYLLLFLQMKVVAEAF